MKAARVIRYLTVADNHQLGQNQRRIVVRTFHQVGIGRHWRQELVYLQHSWFPHSRGSLIDREEMAPC